MMGKDKSPDAAVNTEEPTLMTKTDFAMTDSMQSKIGDKAGKEWCQDERRI
ncbi:hypothetical protein GCM10023229_04330 [Flavisolibacter ginsenosidimutans]